MATNKNSFTAYCDWGNVFDKLTDEQLGKLTRHIWDYVRDKNPETDDQITELLFIPIRDSLKRDLKKWEKRCEINREVGKKGGRPKKTDNPKNPMGYLETERLISKPKKPDNDNDNDNDNVSNNKRIPSYSEFESYALTKRPEVDTTHLKAKFESWVEAGWKDGYGNKILNWKSKLLNTLPHLKVAKQSFANEFFESIKNK